MADLKGLAADIIARATHRPRFLVAIAGAPGAGKSQLATALHAEIDRQAPGRAAVVPMDGYHLDNAVLSELGLLARKGAPATFDVAGLARDLARIRAGEDPVAVPVFDRGLDLARAGGRLIGAVQPIVLVEGNYLLLDEPPWDALAPLFDRTIFVAVPEPELRRRLIARWLHHGLAPDAATARAEGNDLPNAALVVARSRVADVTWESSVPDDTDGRGA